MLISAIAAAALVQAAPQPTATPVPTLKDIPSVTITYFDITGTDDKSIRSSLAAQKPAGASWDVSTNIARRTVNGVCTVERVTPKFTATARLPRLATPDAVSPAMMANWRTYVANLERDAAAQLDFVHSRLGQVQQAVAGASCDEAAAKFNAAIDQLKAQEAAFAQQLAARAAAEQKAADEAAKEAQRKARRNRIR